MSTKSILELEEARNRLQQLREDQASLAQLVSKLRGFCEAVDEHVRLLHEHDAKARGLRDEAAKSASDSKNLLDGLRKDSDTALRQISRQLKSFRSSFEETRSEFASEFDANRSQLTEAFADFQRGVKKIQQALVEQQTKRSEDFEKKQHAELQKLIDAYNRNKVAFDCLKTSVTSAGATIEQHERAFKQALSKARDESEQRVNDALRQVSMTLESACKALHEHSTNECNALSKRFDALSLASENAVNRVRADCEVVTARCSRIVKWTIAGLVASTAMSACAIVFAVSWSPLRPQSSSAASGDKSTAPAVAADAPRSSPPEQPPSTARTYQPMQRDWTDSLGRKTRAMLIGFDGVNAELQKEDGRVYKFPISKLAAPEQAFVREAFPSHGP